MFKKCGKMKAITNEKHAASAASPNPKSTHGTDDATLDRTRFHDLKALF
jgi:hypothetical protein